MTTADTRARILTAAWEISQERGIAAMTLGDVGRRAGVSRQSVYLHFGNKATMLVEMAHRVDRTSGFTQRLAATRDLPPLDGFRQTLEEWFGYVPTILALARALEAAAVNGADGAEAYRDRMDDWWNGIRIAVARLDEAGLLTEGWDVDRATDWVWIVVHPSAYQHLVVERGWEHSVATRLLIDTLEHDLLDGGNRPMPDYQADLGAGIPTPGLAGR